jgi:hypothetical protein
VGQAPTGLITLSNYGVGRVSVDPAMVRGEGGAHDARIVVPVSIEMSPQPAEQQLALVRLSGVLHLDDPSLPQSRIGGPDSVDLTYNMVCRSLPDGSVAQVVELRFSLAAPIIEKLERRRHDAHAHEAVLHLGLEGTVVWLHTTHGNVPPRNTESALGREIAGRFALHSEMSVFWYTRIDSLRLAIDQAQWVRNVLPGLGYNNVRLVELTLPPILPFSANAGTRFAQVQQAFDTERYEDAVAGTRAILSAWNSYFRTGKQRLLADVLGKLLGWPPADPRRPLVDALWKSVTDFANVPHHPEGQETPFDPSPADARLQLLLVTILSDYLGNLLDLHSASK